MIWMVRVLIGMKVLSWVTEMLSTTTKKYALKKESLRAKREPTSSSKRF
jgi:hypothetical protein